MKSSWRPSAILAVSAVKNLPLGFVQHRVILLLYATFSNGNWITVALAVPIVTSRPGTPTSRRIYPRATVRSPDAVRRVATLVISPTSFSSRQNLRSSSDRRRPFRQEPCELAMHVAARSNSLHDLLPHIASLIEVQGTRSARFPAADRARECPPHKRNASRDALHFQRFAAHRRSPGSNQCLPGFVNILGREPDLVGFFAAHPRRELPCTRRNRSRNCIAESPSAAAASQEPQFPHAFKRPRDLGPAKPRAVCFSLISATSTSSMMM